MRTLFYINSQCKQAHPFGDDYSIAAAISSSLSILPNQNYTWRSNTCPSEENDGWKSYPYVRILWWEMSKENYKWDQSEKLSWPLSYKHHTFVSCQVKFKFYWGEAVHLLIQHFQIQSIFDHISLTVFSLTLGESLFDVTCVFFLRNYLLTIKL